MSQVTSISVARPAWAQAVVEAEHSSEARNMLDNYLLHGYRAEISAPLLRRAVEFQRLLAPAGRDIAARYEVGRAINEVWGDDSYGGNALVKLAKLLGRSSSLIYRLANLARAWPDADQFAEMVANANAIGTRLTQADLIDRARELGAQGNARLRASATRQVQLMLPSFIGPTAMTTPN